MHAPWLLAATVCALVFSTPTGCASSQQAAIPSSRSGTVVVPSGIALRSSNLQLLEESQGIDGAAFDASLASRNDDRLGFPSRSVLYTSEVVRDTYNREWVISGRAYNEFRVTTRIRERLD
ncbi:MAG: hypothetical protein SGJ11_00200 [Phycisphaerae bacterium]|nr:hypothetical protein [Phycisphaerae bacterium]